MAQNDNVEKKVDLEKTEREDPFTLDPESKICYEEMRLEAILSKLKTSRNNFNSKIREKNMILSTRRYLFKMP